MPIICPCFSHILESNLHLKHHLGEETYLPNRITNKVRPPWDIYITYKYLLIVKYHGFCYQHE